MIANELFTVERLLATLLDDQHGNRDAWRQHAEIIPAYRPPNATAETRPRCVVRYPYLRVNGERGAEFLRHSGGPRQGHFWDVYGDDYITPELALIALCEAPVPPPLLRGGPNTTNLTVPSAGATGGLRISLERIRQIEQEGYSAGHDDKHVNGELVLAALCYASPLRLYVKSTTSTGVGFDDVWPDWPKRPEQVDAQVPWRIAPLYSATDTARRRLEKAGALIAAELDRLERLRKEGPRHG